MTSGTHAGGGDCGSHRLLRQDGGDGMSGGLEDPDAQITGMEAHMATKVGKRHMVHVPPRRRQRDCQLSPGRQVGQGCKEILRCVNLGLGGNRKDDVLGAQGRKNRDIFRTGCGDAGKAIGKQSRRADRQQMRIAGVTCQPFPCVGSPKSGHVHHAKLSIDSLNSEDITQRRYQGPSGTVLSTPARRSGDHYHIVLGAMPSAVAIPCDPGA